MHLNLSLKINIELNNHINLFYYVFFINVIRFVAGYH